MFKLSKVETVHTSKFEAILIGCAHIITGLTKIVSLGYIEWPLVNDVGEYFLRKAIRKQRQSLLRLA